MDEQLLRRRTIGLAIVAVVTVLLWLPLLPFTQGVARSASTDGELTVAFLDVGQGDGIFIETPDGVQVLIDGGPDATVLRSLGGVMGVGDRTIDVVMGTHPDKDHVAGLVDVLARYQVAQVLRTENVNDTAPSEAFDWAVEAESTNVSYARAGQIWQLGASTTLTILSPASNPAQWESNAASIVALLRFGDTEFLLTGDAGEGTESYLVEEYGSALQAEVLKLGHHGSRTSSSEVFLETVKPQYAVVSAGKDNDYGHPHDEVVKRVGAVGAELVSTAEGGTVLFRSDGKRVWVDE
jgi:competence protein ComEC